MTDKRNRKAVEQSDMYLENFTQIKIYQKKKSSVYRPNKPIETRLFMQRCIESKEIE